MQCDIMLGVSLGVFRTQVFLARILTFNNHHAESTKHQIDRRTRMNFF